MSFNDYIVFVDESGDHSLEKIDEAFPVFVLCFLIIRKDVYSDVLAPKVKALKFKVFGHDCAIFHERDIRRSVGDFYKLSKDQKNDLLSGISSVVTSTDFSIISMVIDKPKLVRRYKTPDHPYNLALQFGLERLHHFLKSNHSIDGTLFVVCESRGPKEDDELELEFRRICDGANFPGIKFDFDIKFLDKKSNSEGLQIADLMARPIGLSVIKPDQPNTSYETLKEKFYCPNGNVNGFGRKVFP